MIIKIYPENPNPKFIEKVVDVLRSGGIIVYPTDSLYGMGLDILNRKGVERIARLKGHKANKTQFSIICTDLSQTSNYTLPISNRYFKLLKRNLPGPFTFILDANNKVPDIFQTNKKTIGIRIPDNRIILEIVREFGHPIVTTSIHEEDDQIEYSTDPELIHERYSDKVDLVVDGGFGQFIASTIVDLTQNEPVILRQGAGELI